MKAKYYVTLFLKEKIYDLSHCYHRHNQQNEKVPETAKSILLFFESRLTLAKTAMACT